MTAADACLICNGPIKVLRLVPIAQFVRERISSDRRTGWVRVVRCEECDFTFYDPRMTPDEEARLYAGYRNEGYQKQRQRSEPGYTAQFNAAYDSDAELERRAQVARAVLGKILDLDSISIALDFGGGSGGFARRLVPNAVMSVYDIDPARGTTEGSAELVIASNVLEHCAFPRKTMEEIRALASAHAYFEVPQDAVAEAMHEHVSYFSEKALRRLVESQFDVVASGVEGAIWCLAKTW